MDRNEIALQDQIRSNIGLDDSNLVFNFSESGSSCSLSLVTSNPRHGESFLFHSVEGKNKVECLEAMLSYVLENRQEEFTYTIQWMVIGDDDLQTSYFSASSIFEALEKFSFRKDLKKYRVISISLNPIS